MNNFTILAQNNNDDYVKQAYLCALSIKSTNSNSKVCLITNEKVNEKYKQIFDDIVDFPWGDHAKDFDWKIHNRWKIYHATPYKEGTVVLDSDMLVLQDLSTWFDFLKKYELYYTSKTYTYRGELIVNSMYRQVFSKYNIPDLFSGFHYFSENDFAHEFYKWMEMITNNYQLFYKKYAGGKTYQKSASMDLTAGITAKILDCEDIITNSKAKYPSFVHMKCALQGWQNSTSGRWQDMVGVYLTEDLVLKIGNYKQSGIFHYTEKDFCKDNFIKIYEKYLGI